MKKITPGLLSWAIDAEADAIEQATRTARLPFVTGHVALMADAHVGKGATIGSVIPTNGAIIPAAVGVDIGCGMIAVETDLRADQLPDDLTALHSGIAAAVPAGVGRGHTDRADTEPTIGLPPITELTSKQIRTTAEQFGSLGSGNHFVEVCVDERDRVWVVLHSGSRGIGNQLAVQHIDAAKGLMRTYFIELDDPGLAYLVEGTPEFDRYVSDMLWAQGYAFENRNAMMDAVLTELRGAVDPTGEHGIGVETERINCHHNFTQREHHRGKDLWITRKGAIKAGAGDLGVIPGSMGTSTFIVRGLGNAASYNSCSHGAGRRMSRSRARKELSADSLRDAMGERAWNRGDARTLVDEHPLAYKDINEVMAAQRDLVEVVHTLRQVLNYKGV